MTDSFVFCIRPCPFIFLSSSTDIHFQGNELFNSNTVQGNVPRERLDGYSSQVPW